MKIFICGEVSSDEDQELLKNTLNNLGLEYKISKFVNQIYINKPFILQETLNYRPDCIICLGSKALNVYINEAFEDKISALRKQEFSFNDIPVRLTYNPKYLNRMGGSRSREYLSWQSDFRQWAEQYNDNYKEESFPTLLFEQDRILDYIKTFANSTELAYDLEASSLSPLMQDFRLGGIGLSNNNTSGYLLIRDYTNPSGELTETTRAKISGFMKYLNRDTTYAFNANYEYLSTLSQFNVKLDNITDVFMLSKCLDIKGGLKEQSQIHLGVRGWTNEIDEALSLLEIILNSFKPVNTVKGLKNRKEFDKLIEVGIRDTIQFIQNKNLKNTEKIISSFNKWIEITTKLYRSEDLAYQYLENWIKYKHSQNDWEIRYTDAPAFSIDENGNKVANYISKYCCLDCLYTLRLKDKYIKEISDKKLEKAADYYNQHMQFGIHAEISGFYWDDKIATNLKSEYQLRMIDSLREFLLLPRAKEILEINSIQEIEILSATNIDQLKKYFNPDSTAPKETQTLAKILSTDKIKMAMMFAYINTELQQVNSTIAITHPILVKILQGFHKNIDNYVILAIKAIINANQNKLLNSNELALLGKYSNWLLPDATSETIEAMSNACFKFLGADPDVESTWSDDYKLIFKYKLTKKISKSISAFVDGRNGRKSVIVVESQTKNGYYNRLREYDPNYNPQSEILLYEPHYGIAAAATRRWSSSFHGLPSSSDVQQCLKPYAEDQIVFKCDYSQFELRILALLAKADSLIATFKSGKDVHRFVASKVFQKSEEEISDTERSFAKKAVFGIVFLKTVQAFADDYMKGDLKAAKEFFEMFFNMFPEIQNYIEGQKERLYGKGYITTIFGDPIYLSYDNNKKSSEQDAIRHSVNYPIQSSASNIAGLTGNRLVKLGKDNNYQYHIPGFIHDCLQVLTPISESFIIFDKIIEYAEELPWQEFGAPIQMDMEIGISNGNLVEFKRLKNKTKFIEDGVVNAKFDGKIKDCDLLFQRLSNNGINVNILEEKTYDKYYSWSDLYVKTNSTYNLNFGTTQKFKSGVLQLTKQ